MLRLLAAAAFVASVSVSCSEISFIEINPPADLQEKIDAIQAEKDAANALLGDKTPIEITVPVVGAEDFSSAYFGAQSQAFPIPTGKRLILDFVNHGSGVNNYNNWNLVVTNPVAFGKEGYKEYLVLRADNWANIKDANSIVIETECPDRNEDGDTWDDFKDIMKEAQVTMTVDHSATGIIVINATAVGKDGSTIKNFCTQNITTTEDVWAFLTTDGSWFELKAAYIAPSEVLEIPDEDAASIAVSGTPASIEIGSDDFWGDGVATVKFTDGTSAQVDTADVNFVVPDLSTVGTKTILYSYSKTKKGNYGPSVAGYYTLEVTNPVTSIAVTKQPSIVYYIYDLPVTINGAGVPVNLNGIEVTATYLDGSTGVINSEMVTTTATVPSTAGEHEIDVNFAGATKTFTAKAKINVVKGTGAVGLADCTTPWWAHFSDNYVLAAGESKTLKMMLYSKAVENYHAPCIALRRNVLTENAEGNMVYPEYAVVRMDHYGWGSGYEVNDNKIVESNWNWDFYKQNLTLSVVEITVSNNGDNTADVLYSVTYPNGEEHFQNYKGIVVDSADLHAALVLEQSYVVFFD